MRLYLLFLLFPIVACTQTKETVKKAETKTTKVEPKNSSGDSVDNCWEDRQSSEEVTDHRGSMVYLVDCWMIEGEAFRYQPCSVPEDFRVEGLKVKVSGTIREIYSTERRAGAPFSMTDIQMIR